MFMKILSRSTLWLEIALLSPAHLSPLTAAAAILHFLLDFLFPSNNLPFSNFLISIYQSFIFVFLSFYLIFFLSIKQSTIFYLIFSFLSNNPPLFTNFFHFFPLILRFLLDFSIHIRQSSIFLLHFSFLSSIPPFST